MGILPKKHTVHPGNIVFIANIQIVFSVLTRLYVNTTCIAAARVLENWILCYSLNHIPHLPRSTISDTLIYYVTEFPAVFENNLHFFYEVITFVSVLLTYCLCLWQ